MKIIRTDMGIETPFTDKTLKEMGHKLILLPDGLSQEKLCEEINYHFNNSTILAL